MRLAVIRQRYTPFGGAERFVEGALEALLERGVAISLYTREWPETRLALIEPHIVDPFHLGRLRRDASFARGVCKAIGGGKADLVQSHERIACCDVFRAGDGVHAVYLDERLAHASPLERVALRASPYHRYVLDFYNLATRGNEVEEYTVSGPNFRTPTAIEPPRSVQLGVQLTF